MEANHVDPQTGKALRQLLRRIMIRCIGAGGDVEAQEAHPLSVLKNQMSVPGLHEAVLAGGRVQQVGEIENTLIRGQLVDGDVLLHGMLLLFFRPCFRGENRGSNTDGCQYKSQDHRHDAMTKMDLNLHPEFLRKKSAALDERVALCFL